MPIEVIMPKVDMDQETGTVLEWLVEVGQTVREGQPLLIIETDKVSIEVEAPGDGRLQGVRAQPGDTIPVGVVIAYILSPGESLPGEITVNPLQPAEEIQKKIGRKDSKPVAATPLAKRVADHDGIDLNVVTGTGKDGRIMRSDLTQTTGLERIRQTPARATPAARRLANQAGLNIAEIVGSGPRGRVQQADVEAVGGSKPVSSDPPLEGTPTPFDGIRRKIAARITASYQEIPHIDFTARVDMSAFNMARTELNTYAGHLGSARISVTALIVKILGSVLSDHPYLNASLEVDEIILWKQVNIGVAVALEEGLIVPVVRNVNQKAISQIANELDSLTRQARHGELGLSDVRGGTFTLSNLGPFGIEQFTAIINPPQSGILAVGATQDEVIPGAEGQPEVRPVMRMTLSTDHRIVDGAVAARFMADLKSHLEAPILLLDSS